MLPPLQDVKPRKKDGNWILQDERVAQSAPLSKGTGNIPVSSARKTSQSTSVTDAQRPRRLSLPSAPQVPRTLSCSDDNFDEIAAAIHAEEPDLDWLKDLWCVCLSAKPSTATKYLAFKSLGGWVEVFNRWQALGGWIPGRAPVFLDVNQLQGLTSAAPAKVAEWMNVFAKKTKAGSEKINMPAFICICVTLSSVISKKQKLRFLLGVFDEDDILCIDEREFVVFISAFLHGLALSYGFFEVRQKALEQAIKALAKRLFSRILAAFPGEVTSDCQSVSFSKVETWFLGDTGDPLAIPFALFMERRSDRGAEDEPEQFLCEEERFKLSHRHAVDPPMETAKVLDASFLRRHEMKVIREVFDQCQRESGFDISHSEAERLTRLEIDPELWCKKLARGLEHAELLRQNGTKISLGLFLKQICPRADQRHLRMFQSWLQELEQKDDLERKIQEGEHKFQQFLKHQISPELTAGQQMLVVKDYRSIQSHTKDEGRNHLVGSVVCTDRLLLFEHEILEDTLSQEDIIALMCPSECRPSKANPVVDENVFNFLTLRVSHFREALAHKESLFGNKQAMPKKCFYKARVAEDLSHSWQQFLDIFDPLQTGCITLKQILRSGLICPEVAQFMCHQVGNGHMFCRNDFLAEMTKISRLR